METKFTSTKKEKVSISTDAEITDIFIQVTVNGQKRTLANGQVVATEYISGFQNDQFNKDNLTEASKVDLIEAINKAIEDFKSK
ncbi:hypothetical protein [Dyadobacter sp. CY312]|uniref:hypothetical protein n=1 Tax=Dyadobacter sp. CY312 TaxID=2907303 RepID=UPI001F24FEFF|nr:hypothetical protein [Dyadobacter sp. CY312]MCE7039001.1 hypothetical protein [Dyadobacter sp. CY312]